MKTLIILLLLITISSNADQPGRNLLINVKSGLTFPGATSYQFYARGILYPVSPGYLLGGGVEYQNAVYLNNASLSFSLEVNYGTASTGNVNIGSETAKTQFTSIPVLLWTKLKTEGQLVPFVRIGFGVDNTKLSESHDPYEYLNFTVQKWFFTWAVGAGIDFNYLNKISLSIFVDSIIKEKGFKENLTWKLIDFDYRNGMVFAGIQFAYQL